MATATIAMELIRKDYQEVFNLLVKFDDWDLEGRDTISVSRILEYTDDTIKSQFLVNGRVDFISLKQMPALLMPETPGKHGNEQLARVAQISEVRQAGDVVHISYMFDSSIPPIANQAIIEILTSAGILEGLEHSRTHWAVKDFDLYACLARAPFRRRLNPTIFKLRDQLGANQRLVSVMMPFSSDFDEVYREIRDAVTPLRLRCLRADDIWKSESIMQDVVDLIVGSEAVVADCTGQNPNVFYEMGIAHTVGRPVIPIVQDGRDIPFDISHLRYIHYLRNSEGLVQLGSDIASRLENLGIVP